MLDDIIKERRKKLEAIKNAGIDPYPARVARDFPITHAIEHFETLVAEKKVVSLAGRLTAVRGQGKIIFADIEDESGKIQAVLKDDITKDFDFWWSVLDLGDFISVTGPLFLTQRGERALKCKLSRLYLKHYCRFRANGMALRMWKCGFANATLT